MQRLILIFFIASELCYYSGFKTAFAISSRTEQNYFGRYPRHKRNRTFCVYFGNAECSFYNQSDTIQAYFDSVIAVNGTARPLLHSCKHSAVARLSFYCNCKSYCLVHFKEHTQIQTITGRCDCGNFIRNNACCDDNSACVQSD